GRISTLDAYTVGTYLYVQETWTARVTRLFSDAGLLGYLDLAYAETYNPVLNQRALNPVSLASYLDDLLALVGGVMSDTPAGHVLIEAATSRTASNPLTIPPADVLYAPRWQKVLPGANKATVWTED